MSMEAVANLLRQRLGLDPESLGAGFIPAVVRKRMLAISVADEGAYARRAQADVREFQELVDAVVVPESWFFRGGAVFAYLAGHIGRAAQSAATPFRVLSVPCASGQEPYSLALALQEQNISAAAYHLEGVDVSPHQVEQARAGVFGSFSFRELESGLQRRYFRATPGDLSELQPPLRGRVHFRVGNVIDPQLLRGEEPFDLIFCRNLLIYLHPEGRRQVLDALDRLLAPGGLLCTGHAEPLAQYDPRFTPTGPHQFFLHRRANVAPAVQAVSGGVTPPGAETHRGLAKLPDRGADAPRSPRTHPGTDAPRSPVVPQAANARQLADAGRLDEALIQCRDQLNGGAPTAALYSLLGVIHQARHEDAEAAAAFQKALYLNPDYAEALLHLLLLHQRRGDTAQVDRLRQRLRRTPGGDS